MKEKKQELKTKERIKRERKRERERTNLFFDGASNKGIILNSDRKERDLEKKN